MPGDERGGEGETDRGPSRGEGGVGGGDLRRTGGCTARSRPRPFQRRLRVADVAPRNSAAANAKTVTHGKVFGEGEGDLCRCVGRAGPWQHWQRQGAARRDERTGQRSLCGGSQSRLDLTVWGSQRAVQGSGWWRWGPWQAKQLGCGRERAGGAGAASGKKWADWLARWTGGIDVYSKKHQS